MSVTICTKRANSSAWTESSFREALVYKACFSGLGGLGKHWSVGVSFREPAVFTFFFVILITHSIAFIVDRLLLKSYCRSDRQGSYFEKCRVIRMATILPKSFPMFLRREIVLYAEGVIRSHQCLRIRTSYTIFRSASNLPVLIYLLKIRKSFWPSVLSTSASTRSAMLSSRVAVFLHSIFFPDAASSSSVFGRVSGSSFVPKM